MLDCVYYWEDRQHQERAKLWPKCLIDMSIFSGHCVCTESDFSSVM